MKTKKKNEKMLKAKIIDMLGVMSNLYLLQAEMCEIINQPGKEYLEWAKVMDEYIKAFEENDLDVGRFIKHYEKAVSNKPPTVLDLSFYWGPQKEISLKWDPQKEISLKKLLFPSRN